MALFNVPNPKDVENQLKSNKEIAVAQNGSVAPPEVAVATTQSDPSFSNTIANKHDGFQKP